MRLNEVVAVKVGATDVAAVYAGSVQVWPTGDAWAFYRELTLSNAGGGAKTDWPVRAAVTAANFGDGTDLQFRAADGVTVLPHWVEEWATTGYVWVLVPSIGAGASVTVRCYYDNPDTVDLSDGAAVFPRLFDDFDDPLVTTYEHSRAIGNVERYANPVFTPDGQPWRVQQWERGSMVEDPDEPDPSRRFKLYTSGRSASNVDRIGVLFSPDGIVFTEHTSNPVLQHPTNPSTGLADPCVVLSAGVYHLFCESSSGAEAEVWHFTSADGITFAFHSVAIPFGGSGAWDERKCGTPTVFPHGGMWWMTYDGRPVSGLQNVGFASSPDLYAWTRSPNNPIITDPVEGDIVPSDVINVNGTWWMHVKDAGFDQVFWTTTDDPADWDSSSFTKTSYTAATGDMVVIDEEQTRVSMEQKTNGLWLGDIVGSERWTFDRTLAFRNPRLAKIEAHSGVLKFAPAETPSSAQSYVGYTNGVALTSGWALNFRMAKQNEVLDELYTRIGVGSGGLANAAGNLFWRTWANGYGVLFGRPAQANSRLWETAAGAESTLGSAFTVSAFSNMATFELRYTAAGVLSLVRDGTSLRSVTDTTLLATEKEVALTQGQTNSNGARSTFDWVFARPFDGVDPSVSVGSEVAT